MTSREYPRRPGRVDVTLPVDLQASDAAFGGVARNLGFGGMFVTADQMRQVGDELVLAFSLPGHARSISVRAEVRWVRTNFVSDVADPPGMGLRFLVLTTGGAIALADFVRQADSTSRSLNRA